MTRNCIVYVNKMYVLFCSVRICHQGNCVHRLISSELHVSVLGTKTISSDKETMDISDTLLLLYFVKIVSEHRYDIRVSESCVDPNP